MYYFLLLSINLVGRLLWPFEFGSIERVAFGEATGDVVKGLGCSTNCPSYPVDDGSGGLEVQLVMAEKSLEEWQREQ
jgi:hypothetical protein